MERRSFLGSFVLGAIGAALSCTDGADTAVGTRPRGEIASGSGLSQLRIGDVNAPLDASAVHLALERAGVRSEDVAYGFALAVLARDLLADSPSGKLAMSNFPSWARKAGFADLGLEPDAIEVRALLALGDPEVRKAVVAGGPDSIATVSHAIQDAVGTEGALGKVKTHFVPNVDSPAFKDALWVMGNPTAAEHIPSTPRIEQYVELIFAGIAGDDLVKRSGLSPGQLRQLLRVSIGRQMGLSTQPLT